MLNINFTEAQILQMVEDKIDKTINTKIDQYLNSKLNKLFGSDRDFNKTVKGMLHAKLDTKMTKIAEETDISKLIDIDKIQDSIKEIILEELRDNLSVNLKWN